MKRRTKTIRVFVSSTFEDLKMERDALQKHAFKNLREYCKQKGWQFQAVDLRWGINNEATIDQRTMEICLREIERCQEQSPRPNFIVLLGERYGWRPLPDTVLLSVWLQMEKEMPEEIHSLFKQWYELDENQLPEAVWRLRPREGRFIDYSTYEETAQKPLVAFFTQWAANNLPDPDDNKNSDDPRALQRLKMERSATEQEIHAGAFRVADAHEHVFTFFRDMPECPSTNEKYIDADNKPVQRLRSHLEDFLPDENICFLKAGWDENTNQPKSKHLDRLSEEVENRLKGIIDKEIENYKLIDENEIEQLAHDTFALERTFGFSGREKDIKLISDYAGSNSNTPLVVWGESGTGKSSLLAMSAIKLKKAMPDAHILSRFIGITGKASSGHTLLTDLCMNLCDVYGGDTKEIPQDPAKLQANFPGYLSKASREKPLVLFLDALDQFNENDPFRQLTWLPAILPDYVRVIISTLQGESFDILHQRESPAPVFHEITPLTPEDGRTALNAWLTRVNRTLQDHQKEQIISDFEHAGCTPLYLHLAFEQAQRWESFKRKQRLGRDIPEMIEDLYAELSRPEAHGSIVEKVLTAIRCAKHGLSDDEILGVLATDDEFWSNFGIQTYHVYDDGEKEDEENIGKDPRLVPPVLWIRLFHDLEYYLTRRNAPGGEVITYYHRQLAEAVDQVYLSRPGYRQNRHKDIAVFFASKRWLLQETPLQLSNIRKCDELPWQQIKGEMWDEVTETLCDLDFIQAKCVAGMAYELVKDYNNVLKSIPDNAENVQKEKARQIRMEKYTQDLIACAKGEITANELDIPESITPWTKEQINTEIERIKTKPNRADRLKDFKIFLGQEAGNLQNHAYEFKHLSTQQAWNYANDGPVGKIAESGTPEKRNSLLLHSQPTRPPWNPKPQAVQTLQGHTHNVNAVALSPDGKRAISGSRDKTCILWDLESGQAVKTLQGHTSEVNAVALSPDGKRVISGSEDKTCILWDLESGQAVKTLQGHTNGVNAVALSPDGKRVISGSGDNTCILWDLESGQAVQTLQGHTSPVVAVALSPDGKRAISGSWDDTCILWDLESGQAVQTLQGHTSSVTAVALSPDGKRAISGSWDDTCILWDLESGQAVKTLHGHTHMVNAVALSPDGKRAISGSRDMTCILWDLESGQAVKTLHGHTILVSAVALSPDGKRAISGSHDMTCILWDMESGQAVKTLHGHTDMVHAFALSPDGKRAISGSWDETCILWDLENGQAVKTLHGNTDMVNAVALSPDGKRAISGSCDMTCILWDIESGQTVKTLQGHTDWVNAVALSPDGKRAISGSWDNTCILWDLENGQAVKTLQGHTGRVYAVALSPDGKRAISGSSDRTCILWDMESGQAVKTLHGHTHMVNAVALSPDGKRAISGSSDRTCILWDMESGQAVKTLHGHTILVSAVALSPDGKRAISGSWDRTCILWDMESGQKLALFRAVDPINIVAFFAGGVFIGGDAGVPHILSGNRALLCPGRGVITVRKIWDFEFKRYQPLSADCPFCGNRFSPPQKVLDTIKKITKKAGLLPEQSPCLELPDEVWEEPGLLSECPKCGEGLKFNPFVAGGEEY